MNAACSLLFHTLLLYVRPGRSDFLPPGRRTTRRYSETPGCSKQRTSNPTTAAWRKPRGQPPRHPRKHVHLRRSVLSLSCTPRASHRETPPRLPVGGKSEVPAVDRHHPRAAAREPCKNGIGRHRGSLVPPLLAAECGLAQVFWACSASFASVFAAEPASQSNQAAKEPAEPRVDAVAPGRRVHSCLAICRISLSVWRPLGSATQIPTKSII